MEELFRKTAINETWRVQLFSCITELFREDPVWALSLQMLIYVYIYISGWIFQKVLAEIVQKDLILSQKALISNRRNLGLFAPTSMRFPSKDSKSKDLSF